MTALDQLTRDVRDGRDELRRHYEDDTRQFSALSLQVAELKGRMSVIIALLVAVVGISGLNLFHP